MLFTKAPGTVFCGDIRMMPDIGRRFDWITELDKALSLEVVGQIAELMQLIECPQKHEFKEKIRGKSLQVTDVKHFQIDTPLPDSTEYLCPLEEFRAFWWIMAWIVPGIVKVYVDTTHHPAPSKSNFGQLLKGGHAVTRTKHFLQNLCCWASGQRVVSCERTELF